MNIGIWIGALLVVCYFGFLGWWLYRRFIKVQLQNLKTTNDGGKRQLVLEHDGHKIVIDYDSLKNTVKMEFNEGGMTFRIVDGLFYEPLENRTPKLSEIETSAATDDDDEFLKTIKSKDSGLVKM